VALRRASKARLAKDLPHHFFLGLGWGGAEAGSSVSVEAESDGSVDSSRLQALALELILAQLLGLPLPLAMVTLFAFSALLALILAPAFFALLALLATLLVNGLAAARVRPPSKSSGVGDRPIEGAAAFRGESWLAVSNVYAGGEARVNGDVVEALMCLP